MLSHPLSQQAAVMYIGDGPVLHYFCEGKHLFCIWEREGGWSDSVSGLHHWFSSVKWLVQVWQEFEGKEWQLSGLPGSSRYHTIHQVFALRRNFYPVLTYLLRLSVCLFSFFFFSFPVCNIWMNLVFHALFVLKVGVCFLIGTYFSELCVWFLVGDKMLVSFYWSARFVKCIYINCMHRATWSVQLVALDMAQEFQTHTLFELFVCIRLKSYSQVTRNTKRKDVISSLWYTHAVAICVCVWERERERESHNENKVRDEQRAQHKHFKA